MTHGQYVPHQGHLSATVKFEYKFNCVCMHFVRKAIDSIRAGSSSSGHQQPMSLLSPLCPHCSLQVEESIGLNGSLYPTSRVLRLPVHTALAHFQGLQASSLPIPSPRSKGDCIRVEWGGLGPGVPIHKRLRVLLMRDRTAMGGEDSVCLLVLGSANIKSRYVLS